VDRVKAFLTRTGPFGLPMYAYVGGAVALIGGIWYFRTHNTGPATAAPQVNASTATDAPPYPYPGGGGVAVPPTPPFSTGSTSATGSTSVGTGSVNSSVAPNANLLPSATSTFIPTAPVDTTSQTFAASVVPASTGPAAIAQPVSIPNPFGPQYPDITVAGTNKTSGTIAQRNTSGATTVPVATPAQAVAIAKALAPVPIIGNIIQRIVYPPPPRPPAPPSPPPAYRAPTAATSGRSGPKFV
jgi:hypothetical protein